MRKDLPIIPSLLSAAARKAKVQIVLEPEWGVVGQLSFPNGRKRYFKYSALDVNPMGAAQVAKDKDFANFFMKRMGYPTIPGRTFFSDAWAKTIHSKRTEAAAYQYARRIGFPVIVKPNSGSHGRGVVLAYTKRDFMRALDTIFTYDPVALVQKPVKGKDYRIVVFDGAVIAAYERRPLSVVGDGMATIATLLKRKASEFKAASRDTWLAVDDPRIPEKLKRQKLTLRSIPAKGERVFLLDNANLSTGGDAVDVTDTIHKAFGRSAIALTKDMGLVLCGVDFLIEGNIEDAPNTARNRHWVLEVNGSPGMDHFAQIGTKQRTIVAQLCVQLLKYLR